MLCNGKFLHVRYKPDFLFDAFPNENNLVLSSIDIFFYIEIYK